MKCCFVNGSPKGTTGNTEIFIQEMRKGMSGTSDVFYVCKERPKQLALTLMSYDRIILVMPLYVFAMPGIVLELMEEMTYDYQGRSFGVIIQQGFDESSHALHLKTYMHSWIAGLHAQDLGCVIRGGSAGFCFMPEKMYRKAARQLQVLGSYLEQTGTFKQEIVKQFALPYTLGPWRGALCRTMSRLGLTNLFWNKMMKEHHAFEHRFDRPYS